MASVRLAGAYRPVLASLPIPRAPKVAGIQQPKPPSLNQLLQPSARERAIRSELGTLPSPKAIGLLTSRDPRGQQSLLNAKPLNKLRA